MNYKTAFALVNHYDATELRHFVAEYLSTESFDVDNALCVLNRARYYPIKGEYKTEDNIRYGVIEVNPFRDEIYTEFEVERTRWYKNEEEANSSSYNYSNKQTEDYPISRVVKATERKFFTYNEWTNLSTI